MGIVAVLVRVADALDNPIQGVLAQVYSAAGSFLTEGVTSILTGETSFTLPGSVAGIPYQVILGKNEWSFPPSNGKNILVTDPPSPNNTFEFQGQYGTDQYPVVLRVLDDSVLQVPVEGVTIRVFDQDDSFITTVVTDSAGEAKLSLPGAPSPGLHFIVRFNKTGVTFGSPVQALQVLQDNGFPYGEGGYGEGGYGGSGLYPVNRFEFSCHVRTLPDSPNPYMCRLSGTLRDASLMPFRNAEIEFSMISVFPDILVSGLHYINDPTVVDGHIIAKPVKVKSDLNGYVEIDLIQGAEYEAFIHGWQHPDGIAESIMVPTSASARLEDVLFPYVARIDFDETAMSLLVGQSKEVAVVATASNRQEISAYEDLVNLLEFTSSDDAVMILGQGVTKTLSVSGLSVGTATILVTRRDYSNAQRIPPIPALQLSDLTITVT